MTKPARHIVNPELEGRLRLTAEISSSQAARIQRLFGAFFQGELTIEEAQPPHPLLCRVSYEDFEDYRLAETKHITLQGVRVRGQWNSLVNNIQAQGDDFPVRHVATDAGEWLEGDLPWGLAALREQNKGTVGVSVVVNMLRQRAELLEQEQVQAAVERAVVVFDSESFS